MNAWRRPRKVVHVLQDGRVYILYSGQEEHFERLKPHHGGPTEFVALFAGSGERSLYWILSLSVLLKRY